MTPEQRERQRESRHRYRKSAKGKATQKLWRDRNIEKVAFYRFVFNEENKAKRAAYQRRWKERTGYKTPPPKNVTAGTIAARQRCDRRKHIANVKDKAALELRIVSAAESVAGNVNAELRQEIISRLVEGVYSGRFPIRLTHEHRSAIVSEYFRQFSKFDTVSLDEVIGENGFTRGNALGVL